MQKRKVIVIGSGPAGYAAAIYLARAELKPVVLAGEKSGGQLMLTSEIENYPGFTEGIMGPQLMLKMRDQAVRFGAEIKEIDIKEVDFKKHPFSVGEYETEAVIIATGAESVPLGVEGEAEYIGRGVSYCAVCDAAFFKQKIVAVVGGGDAAMEDTLALTKFAKKIILIHRRDQFRASKIMQERVLKQKDKIEVRWNTMAVQVKGDKTKVNGLIVKDTQTGAIQELGVEGVFVAIGHKPATQFLNGQIELDDKGYVKTGLTYGFEANAMNQNSTESIWLKGYPTMTSVPGVFAAGDNVDFRYKQAGTAGGFGIMAALDAERWMDR